MLVYIARRGSADAQSFDKVGGLHLAGNCHWRGHAEPFNPKLNVGHVRFDAAARPSTLANQGGKNYGLLTDVALKFSATQRK